MHRFLPAALLLTFLALASACTQNTPQTAFPLSTGSPILEASQAAPAEPAMFAARGVVQLVTIDNMGRPTMVLVKSGEQQREITFPPELAVPVGGSLKAGDTVEMVVVRIGFKGEKGDIPVYRLMSLRDANGRMYAAPSMASSRYMRAEGVIKDLHKEANGVVSMIQLDTGDIIRITPRMARQNPVEIGETFNATGPSVFLPNGGKFVFAEELNGLSMRTTLPPGGWGARVVGEDGEYYDEGGEMDYGEYDFGGEF